jgi:hypothetical protein
MLLWHPVHNPFAKKMQVALVLLLTSHHLRVVHVVY